MKMKLLMSLISAGIAFVSLPVCADDDSGDSSMLDSLSFGTLVEKGEKAAVAGAAKLKKDIERPFVLRDFGGYTALATPSFDISATEDGHFDHMNAGIDLLGINSLEHHPLIVNAGVEASRHFDSYAGLLEVGWFYRIKKPKNQLTTSDILIKSLQSGAPLVALQGGYKFAESTNYVADLESQKDKSEEDEDTVLGRIKFEAGLSTVELNKRMKSTKRPFSEFGFLGNTVEAMNNRWLSINPSLCGKAWVDVANGEFYHQETVGVEIGSKEFAETTLGKFIFKKGKLDFSYNWGSGAPLFNRGEYFSAALKMEL